MALSHIPIGFDLISPANPKEPFGGGYHWQLLSFCGKLERRAGRNWPQLSGKESGSAGRQIVTVEKVGIMVWLAFPSKKILDSMCDFSQWRYTMNAGQKEKQWMLAGLGMIFIGCVWLGLSVVGILGGMAGMFGYFLGAGLAFCGLLVAGIYFYRWQRIKTLLQSNDVLVKWRDGENQIIITPTCAYAYGELYLWGIPGTRLEDVQIEHKTVLSSDRSYLRISIGEASSRAHTIPGYLLWRTKELSIRIPEGQELAAQRVLEELGLRKN